MSMICSTCWPVPTIQASPDSVTDLSVRPKAPKKKKAPAMKSTQGRAGGLDTAGVQGEMDTRATRRRPSHTLPKKTLFDGPTE
jgi:hypothetical protein